MNEKPQEAREDERTSPLEQIFTQSLNKMQAPTQTMAVEEDAPPEEISAAPEQADSVKNTSPARKKNRRSAVYLYLLILFGAAFLMLLLAYFAQQRSNESASSDLRSTMSLSRKELLDEDFYRHPNKYEDLLDAHFDKIVGAAAARSANVSRETER